MLSNTILPVLFCTLITMCASAQNQTKAGPEFDPYGKVYAVPDANFPKTTEGNMHAVFDVSRQYKDRPGPNPLIETAARYYNLHLQNGYASTQLKAALVVHGSAVFDLLSNEAYREKFGKDNPNAPLVEALIKKGVTVVLCGQSATHHGVALNKSVPGTKMALSAMTALVSLQNEGYRLIRF